MDLDYNSFLNTYKWIKLVVLESARDDSEERYNIIKENSTASTKIHLDKPGFRAHSGKAYLTLLQREQNIISTLAYYGNSLVKYFYVGSDISTVYRSDSTRTSEVQCLPFEMYTEELFFQKSLLGLDDRQNFFAEALTAFCHHDKLPKLNIILSMLPDVVQFMFDEELNERVN